MSFFDRAITYADAGWEVFPLIGKRPLTDHSFLDSSRDAHQIAAWAADYPRANVGLRIPDGIAVIDIDPRHDGDRSWAALCQAHGPLARTTTVASGGGGAHLFLAIPPGVALPSKLGLGVDVKQFGGYVLAAGSVHPETGRTYDLIDPCPPAPAPAWILAQARPRGATRAPHAVTDGPDPREAKLGWDMRAERAITDVERVAIDAAVAAIEPIAVEGQRYTVLNKMGATLARKGWSRSAIEAFARASIAAYGGKDPEHGVRGCLAGIGYPSGYHDLIRMAGALSSYVGRDLDALPNPWGDELQRARAGVSEAMVVKSEPDSFAALWDAHESWMREDLDEDLDEEPGDDVVAALGNEIDIDADEVPLEYVVAGYPWHVGAVNGIVGFANTGKTPFAMALATALASGVDFAGGRVARRGRVLVVAYESRAATHRCIKRIARGMGITLPAGSVRIVGAEVGALTDRKHLEVLTRAAKQFDYVVIDTYNAGMTGTEFNDPGFATAAKMLEVEGCALFVVLHTNKAEDGPPTLKSITGTGAIAGALKAVVGLWRPDPCDKHMFEGVCVRDAGGLNHPPMRWRWIDTADGGLRYEMVARDESTERERYESQADKQRRYEQMIPSYWSGKPDDTIATLPALVEHCKATDAKIVKRAATALIDIGKVQSARKGRKGETVEAWRLGSLAPSGPGHFGAATHAQQSRASPMMAGQPRLPGQVIT